MRNTSRMLRPSSGLPTTQISSPAATSPSTTMRKYAPGRIASVKRRGNILSFMRTPSRQQGMRGSDTSSTALPIFQRSPMSASFTSIPSVVRFSPNSPCPSARPISCPHHRASSAAYAYTALSGPPCALRSAWSSPARFTPRTAIRPATGDFQIALLAGRPLYSNSRGLPTLTERTVPAALAIGFCLVDDKQLGADIRVRAMRLGVVGHLIAHPRAQRKDATVFQLGAELALGAKQDVPLDAPMIREI